MMYIPNQLIGAPVGTEVTVECTTEASPKVGDVMTARSHTARPPYNNIDNVQTHMNYLFCSTFYLLMGQQSLPAWPVMLPGGA